MRIDNFRNFPLFRIYFRNKQKKKTATLIAVFISK